jgi:hypothetical protein
VSTIFAVDPAAAPIGNLTAIKPNFESDPAKTFQFPK